MRTTTTRKSFSTTASRPDDNNNNNNNGAGQDKPTGHQRSAQAASRLGSLARASGSPVRITRVPVDGAPPRGNAPPGVISVSSLKGPLAKRLGQGRFANREGGEPKLPGFRSIRGSPAFQPGAGGPRPGPAAGGRPSYGASRLGTGRFAGRPAGPGGPGGNRGPARFGGPGRPGARFGGPRSGPGGGRSKGAAGRPRRERKDDDEKDKKPVNDRDEKFVLSPEEQTVINRIDQGVRVPYTPVLTIDNLLGNGPAVATDAALGRAETAIRTMRILGGGMAFNSDVNVTGDPEAARKRYYEEKKPVFMHSVAEKEWLEKSANLTFKPTHNSTRQAIIDQAILGKYKEPKFADLQDTINTAANYQNRTFTYKGSDSKMFFDKLKSLLPAAKPAASASRASKSA